MEKGKSIEKPNCQPEEKEQKIKDVDKVLESLHPEDREIIVGAMMAIEKYSSYSGPLPSPEDFKAYGDAVKDAPERILAMAENQSKHRAEVEKKIVNSSIRESLCGQWMGFAIVLVFIAVSTFLGYNGHDYLAGLIITLVVALAIIFVLKKNPKETKEKVSDEDSEDI